MNRTIQKTALITGTALGAYSLAVLGLYLRQRELLYRAPKLTQSPDLPRMVIPGCELGPALHGWVDNPGQDSALIYFGGSSEPVELRRQVMERAFPDHTRYIIPYRGFAPNRGRGLIVGEEAIKADALRIYACATKNHAHVDILGRSLGTGVALHVAASCEVRRVGLITPYDSILEVARNRYRWLPVGVMLKDRYESWRDALSVKAPIMALLAETDPVTPHRFWESLKKNFSVPIGVATIEGTNHTNIVDSPRVWEELTRFFQGQDPTMATLKKQLGESAESNLEAGRAQAPAPRKRVFGRQP